MSEPERSGQTDGRTRVERHRLDWVGGLRVLAGKRKHKTTSNGCAAEQTLALVKCGHVVLYKAAKSVVCGRGRGRLTGYGWSGGGGPAHPQNANFERALRLQLREICAR